MNEELRNYIAGWLHKAYNDIIAAQRLMEQDPIILDYACFHCQQSVEKSLKGFLCYKECDIKKTHDIDFLLSECAEFDPIFRSIQTNNINDYAVGGRYPDYNEIPEMEETRQHYDLAIQVYGLVKERIDFIN